MPQKINYGTRKALGVYKPQDVKPPIYLLMENTPAEVTEMRQDDSITETPVRRCFCPECQKVQTIDTALPLKGLSSPEQEDATWMEMDLYSMGYGYYSSRTMPRFVTEAACPECGYSASYAALKRVDHEDGSSTWEVPQMLQSRVLSKYTDDQGKTTRLDDRFTLTGKKIEQKADGSIAITGTEKAITEVVDLVRNDIYVSKADIDQTDRSRKNDQVITSVDPFSYVEMPEMSASARYGVRRTSDMAFGDNIGIGWNRLTAHAFGSMGSTAVRTIQNEGTQLSSNMLPITGKDDQFQTMSEALNRKKVAEIEKRFEGMADEIFVDAKKNGLFLSEHHPGSNEDNTSINPDQMAMMACMMVRYPGVYLHAVERTQNILRERSFAEHVKQQSDPDYVVKEPTDPAKARMFRDEARHVAEELCAADDHITKALKGVPDPAGVRKSLEFFVYGKNGERDIPRTVRLKEGEETMSDPYKATKKLKKTFTADPIATASNIYTGLKLGMKSTDDLNKLLAAAEEFKDTTPKRARRNGSYVMLNPPSSDGCNAGIIAPIRSRAMMSFMKRFSQTRDPALTVKSLYGDSADTKRNDTTLGYGLAIETLRMYDSITSYCKIVDNPDEIAVNHDALMKSQMKNYLEHKTLSEAYVDFIERFGAETPQVVNKYAAMVLHDKKMDEALACYKAEGIEAAKEKHPILAETEDPRSALDAWEQESATSRTIMLTTRNGKPLFHKRTLKEIHDELSNMSTKAVGPNQPFEWSQSEKDLEKTYKAPDAEGEWSFHLFKDTYDQVRTAEALSNCVAGKQYTDDVLRGSSVLMYMEDETATRVACIELKIHRKDDGTRGYRVAQFQGPHDNALDARYSDVAMQWLKDNKIGYAGNRDVEKFGTGASFYGGLDADYHHEEIDEADGVVRSVNEMRDIQKRREEMAKEIYGADEVGNPTVPDVPDELKAFLFLGTGTGDGMSM